MPDCEVRSENTQTFIDHPGRHADVLIVAPGRSPLVVEAEYEPAVEVEKDASERLGLRVKGAPRTVEAAIALRYPKTVENAYDLRSALVGYEYSKSIEHNKDALADKAKRVTHMTWIAGPQAALSGAAWCIALVF